MAIHFTVAFPHLPENTKTIDEAAALNVKIDQVVIGSCTNGRLSDMAAAAAIRAGRKVARRVRAIIPATQHVYKECIRLGYMDTFIDAGCVVSTPTCGPPAWAATWAFWPRASAVLPPPTATLLTRMGYTASEVYLTKPAVAAASAIAGHIASPETV